MAEKLDNFEKFERKKKIQPYSQPKDLMMTVKARMYLQLPLRQWGAGNVYLLV